MPTAGLPLLLAASLFSSTPTALADRRTSPRCRIPPARALPHPSRSRASSPPLSSPSASSSSSPSSSCDFSPLRRPICSGAASSAVFVDGIGFWRRGSAAGDRERLLATADGIGGWRPDAAGPVRRLRQLREAAASARWLSLDDMCQNVHKKVRLTLIHGDLHSSKVQVFDGHDGKIAILNQMFLLEFQQRREGSSSSCTQRVPAAAGERGRPLALRRERSPPRWAGGRPPARGCELHWEARRRRRQVRSRRGGGAGGRGGARRGRLPAHGRKAARRREARELHRRQERGNSLAGTCDRA